MPDIKMVIKGLEIHTGLLSSCEDRCPYFTGDGSKCKDLLKDALALLKDALAMLEEKDPVEPTIDEYGKAYCVCGENVVIIPEYKDLPSVRLKYCPECGRRMKWE